MDACASTSQLGGTIGYPRDCSALDTRGGAFEVWCSPGGGVYLWARLDGVKIKVPYTCNLTFDGAVYPVWPPMSVETSQFEARGGAFAQTGDAHPRSHVLDSKKENVVVLDATASALRETAGKATIWLVTEQSGCPGSPQLPRTVRSGIPFVWP